MKADREKWNRKYREQVFPVSPSRIVREFHHHAKAGRALDLACGNGRNACFLSSRGFAVDAVDIAEEGLRRFACRPANINRICQDLDTFPIPAGRYQIIVNTRYLLRSLFPAIHNGLSTGGILIFESYLQELAPAGTRRFGRDHLLRESELCHAFPGLETIAYREGPSRQRDAPSRKASLVAIRRG